MPAPAGLQRGPGGLAEHRPTNNCRGCGCKRQPAAASSAWALLASCCAPATRAADARSTATARDRMMLRGGS